MVQDILQDAVTCVMDVTFQKIVENPMRQKKMDVQITTILSKDGFVNTISARAPSHSPSKLFTSDSEIEKGIWYIMPVYNGDHMSLQGGFSIKNDITDFYIRHMIKINNL